MDLLSSILSSAAFTKSPPSALQFLQAFRCPIGLVGIWHRTNLSLLWRHRSLCTVLGLVLTSVSNTPAHRRKICFLAPEKLAVLAGEKLLLPRLSPAESHRSLDLFVQASYVAVVVDRFDVRDVSVKVATDGHVSCRGGCPALQAPWRILHATGDQSSFISD